MEEKLCKKCMELLPLKSFSKDNGNKIGYQSMCKKCHYEYETEYRKKRRLELRRINRKYDNSEGGIKTIEKYKKTHKEERVKRNLIYAIKYPKRIVAINKLNCLFSNKESNISNDDFTCAICSKQPIEKHHDDYNLWNVFIPLCHGHHKQVHVSDLIEWGVDMNLQQN